MIVDRTTNRTYIGFQWTREDEKRWGWDRFELFKNELKRELPVGGYTYNPVSQFWSVRREHEDLFDALRAKHFKDEKQGGLFE
jgi:hypothetical protein